MQFEEWIRLAYEAKNQGLTKFLLEEYAKLLSNQGQVVCNPFFHDLVYENLPTPGKVYGDHRTVTYQKWPKLAKGEFFVKDGEVFQVIENLVIGGKKGTYSQVGSIFAYRRIENPSLYQGKEVKNF